MMAHAEKPVAVSCQIERNAIVLTFLFWNLGLGKLHLSENLQSLRIINK